MKLELTKSSITAKLIELNKSFFLYAVLFPFICFPTFNTDLQPLAGLFGLLILFGFSHNKFNSRQITILFFIAFFLLSTSIFIFYEIFFSSFNIKVFQFSKLISVFYGLIIFFIFQSKSIFFTDKIINNVILVYAFCTLLFIMFGENYLYFQSFIVNQRLGDAFVSSLESYRGISILTPEPSVFSSILIFLFLMNEYFNYDKKDKRRFYFNALLLILMLFLSKSATGFLLLFFYIFYKFISSKKMFLYILFLTPIIFIVISNFVTFNIEGNRAANFFSTIIYNFDKLSIYEILKLDASSYKRYLDFTVSFFSLKYHILGTGFSGFYQSLNEIALNNFNYLEYYNTEIGRGLVSPFSYGLMMFGLLFLLLIVYIITLKKVNMFQKFYFLFHICFSISFGLPITWIILAYNKKQIL